MLSILKKICLSLAGLCFISLSSMSNRTTEHIRTTLNSEVTVKVFEGGYGSVAKWELDRIQDPRLIQYVRSHYTPHEFLPGPERDGGQYHNFTFVALDKGTTQIRLQTNTGDLELAQAEKIVTVTIE